MTNPLTSELATYKKLLPELQSEEGKYALIHLEELEGVFDTYGDALEVAYKKYGTESQFLVKQIHIEDQVQYFSRNLRGPSCHV